MPGGFSADGRAYSLNSSPRMRGDRTFLIFGTLAIVGAEMKYSLTWASPFVLGLALVVAPSLGHTDSTSIPCAPPQIAIEGGESATTPCATASSAYSTNFNSTENPISEGGKWVDGRIVGLDWNNPRTLPGQAFASVLSGATGSRYDDSIAHLSTSVATFTANQFAQATVYKVSGYTTDPTRLNCSCDSRRPHTTREAMKFCGETRAISRSCGGTDRSETTPRSSIPAWAALAFH